MNRGTEMLFNKIIFMIWFGVCSGSVTMDSDYQLSTPSVDELKELSIGNSDYFYQCNKKSCELIDKNDSLIQFADNNCGSNYLICMQFQYIKFHLIQGSADEWCFGNYNYVRLRTSSGDIIKQKHNSTVQWFYFDKKSNLLYVMRENHDYLFEDEYSNTSVIISLDHGDWYGFKIKIIP